MLYNYAVMRVLIVNTSEMTGGAAIAANRLKSALNNNGVKAKMLVGDKVTDDITVVGLGHRLLRRWRFLYERWCIFCHLHFSRNHLFEIDTAQCGSDITRLPEFKEADVIHLHWINQGMLSLRTIRRILESGKPVVWTMHDIWPATGICHCTLTCRRFEHQCSNCRLLPGGGSRHDLSARVWRRKKNILSRYHIAFVACSKWLAGEARKSTLLREQKVFSVPNTIDTHVFCSKDRTESRTLLGLPEGKKFILFVSQRVTNELKGMKFLVDACHTLAKEHPEMLDNTAVLVLGGHSDEMAGAFDFPVYTLDYTSDVRRLVAIYNAADVFVLPSLSENLPNTIMEAMACGVPCVGFNVGGIPEEIDHRHNGYVAKYRDEADLAKGMYWVLYETDYEELSLNAQRKVAQCYSQNAVAMKYIDIYNQAMAIKRYKL